MTGFSVVPLQVFSIIGVVISALSLVFVGYLAIRRLVIGPEVEGVFTLFGSHFLHWRVAGPGCDGRIHRAHLRTGAPAATLRLRFWKKT